MKWQQVASFIVAAAPVTAERPFRRKALWDNVLSIAVENRLTFWKNRINFELYTIMLWSPGCRLQYIVLCSLSASQYGFTVGRFRIAFRLPSAMSVWGRWYRVCSFALTGMDAPGKP